MTHYYVTILALGLMVVLSSIIGDIITKLIHSYPDQVKKVVLLVLLVLTMGILSVEIFPLDIGDILYLYINTKCS